MGIGISALLPPFVAACPGFDIHVDPVCIRKLVYPCGLAARGEPSSDHSSVVRLGWRYHASLLPAAAVVVPKRRHGRRRRKITRIQSILVRHGRRSPAQAIPRVAAASNSNSHYCMSSVLSEMNNTAYPVWEPLNSNNRRICHAVKCYYAGKGGVNAFIQNK